MLRAALLMLACWCALAAPAGAAIGTPTQIGSASIAPSVSGTLTVPFTASAAVGDLVAVMCATTNAATMNNASLTDTQGNSYSQGTGYLGGGGLLQIRVAYAVLTAPITNADGISIVFSSSNGRKMCTAVKVSGMQSPTSAVHDHTGAGATATSSTPGITTSTFAQPDTLVLAMVQVDGSAANDDIWTEDGAWTAFLKVAEGGRVFRTAYKVVSSTSALTYAPSSNNPRTWVANYESFRAMVASTCGARTLLGAGC